MEPTTEISQAAPVAESTPSSAISQAIPAETPKESSEPIVEAAKPEEVKPVEAAVEEFEEYELSLAENSNLSVEELNEIATEASRLGLSKEDAEKLIAAREGAFSKGLSKAEAAYVEKIQKAKAEIEADPAFIGEKKLETFASINRAVQQFGDPELVALLNTPEVGNNLVIAKFLKRLGDAIAPDTLPGKGTFSSSNGQEDASLKNLYPEFYK